MKLQSGYGLKEKIRDDRKLTLRLQWYQLTTTEAKQVSEQLAQMAQDVFEGQGMFFTGTMNQKEVNTVKFKLPWKDKQNLQIYLKGFVRTDESVREQRKRVREKLFIDANRTIMFPHVRRHPLFPKVQQQALQLIKDSFGKNETDYVTGAFPVETMFSIRRRYCNDGTYSLRCSISVSAYALGYDLQELLAQYQAYLRMFYQKTGLFAGYILYETKPLGAHDFYHLFPGKIPMRFEEEKYLAGYEWAAFLSNDLVRQLTNGQLEELEKHADITKESSGLFYQTKCDITAYGLEQKRVYESIFHTILKPGFQYMPAHEIYMDKIQPANEKAYLLREKNNRYFWMDPSYCVGFFYKLKPEDTHIPLYYEVLEEINLTD